MFKVLKYLPFASATTGLQASTYLLGVCLFSISFLVFLNSSISFVITDLIGIKHGVGDLVGTLGFADELVALVACPVWGILSDRLGVRTVCVCGYTIVGLSLLSFVQAKNIYPQLLFARLFFSIGGAATATMVTAILPAMTGGGSQSRGLDRQPSDASAIPDSVRHSIAPSLDSQVTITQERFTSRSPDLRDVHSDHESPKTDEKRASPPRLAGLVGVFTGCGALIALLLFLPLPSQFSKTKGMTQAQAVADSFYVVGAVALLVAAFCFVGLRNILGEEKKGWRLLLGKPATFTTLHPNSSLRRRVLNGGPEISQIEDDTPAAFLPYFRLLIDSTILGFKDAQIGMGYLGGFVARASSVGISLFVPLYINAYFISNGFCKGSPTDPSPELKKECRAAYVLAAELTGSSQLIALLCAPLFGYLSDRYRRFNFPLLVASLFGIVGYVGFASLASPEATDINGRGGSPIVFLAVACIGISQIGAIVCSLGLLGRGVLGDEGGYNLSSQLRTQQSSNPRTDAEEDAPLLAESTAATISETRNHLKGSIAGVYSMSGGAAILLLTKLGGYLFDAISPGAPFYMMAMFNAVLLVVGIASGIYREVRTNSEKR